MLLKPSMRLFAESLRVLSDPNLTFDATTGFNGVGRPRSLASVDLVTLAAGMTVHGDPHARRAVQRRLRRTEAYARNNWTFVGASGDQGLFWYLFYVRRNVGTWAGLWSERQSREAGLSVDHFWGAAKPWTPDGACRDRVVSRYLWRLQQPPPSPPPSGRPEAEGVGEGECTRVLLGILRRLQHEGRYVDGDNAGATDVAMTPWLPEGLGFAGVVTMQGHGPQPAVSARAGGRGIRRRGWVVRDARQRHVEL